MNRNIERHGECEYRILIIGVAAFTRMSYGRRASISNSAELHSGCDERHARSKLNYHDGN